MTLGMNKVILIGNVDGSVQYRPHEKGRHRLWFRLRTTEQRPDEDGVFRERLGWHTIVVWGALAQTMNRYLRGETRVAIEGRLTTRKVTSAGASRWETEIHARELILLDGPPSEGAMSPASDPVAA
ncbi:MAG: single-stranded DNA-binding protein [Sandaracinaceae bacterium]